MLLVTLGLFVVAAGVLIGASLIGGAAADSASSLGSRAADAASKSCGMIVLSQPPRNVRTGLAQRGLLSESGGIVTSSGVEVMLVDTSKRTVSGFDCRFDESGGTDSQANLADVLRLVRRVDPNASVSFERRFK